MKTFKNQDTQITDDGGEEFFMFSNLAVICVKYIPQGGLDLEDMDTRLKLFRKLSTHSSTISLEDSEAKKLKECVNKYRWAMIHDDLISFGNYVKEF